MLTKLEDYTELLHWLDTLQPQDKEPTLRDLCRTDLFFLLWFGLGRIDAWHQWILDRCKEVQASPNEHLDLWAREHYKSTVITFALTIQDILSSHGDNPDPKWNGREATFGIFSVTRPIAKGFLRQIKLELEQNDTLKSLFPDILYQDPKGESPKWSEDDGLIVKRKTNPKEATVEAWGIVDGQPTSKHFLVCVYDDLVTDKFVTSPDMIEKTNRAWEMSINLGTEGGHRRYVGTIYHFNDTYRLMKERGAVIPRVYPCTEDGTPHGKPVLKSKAEIEMKYRMMGSYTFCLPSDAPVLMADFTEKNISEIKQGDTVIGYALEKGKRTKIVPAMVKAVQVQRGEVWEYTLASGRTVQCTAEHKWYTGRSLGGTHNVYAKIDTESNNHTGTISHLSSFYDPRQLNLPYDEKAASWLSGFYDGEGSASGNCVHFHQSEKYPEILERLEMNLGLCNFDYGLHVNRNGKKPHHFTARDYYLRGGREQIMRFLHIAQPAKGGNIIKALYNTGKRCFPAGKYNRDKVVAKRSLGIMDVYNMETETGNYIAYGYASKNSSQMLLNPVADTLMGFKREWIRYYPGSDGATMNIYILVDPANAKKTTSDYTVFMVIGLGTDDNYYVLDMVRDRLSLTERADTLFKLHRKYKPVCRGLRVGYEQYGMQADIQHIQDKQNRDNYRFDITELGGRMPKIDRIKQLQPIFQQHRFYILGSCFKTDYQGKTQDLVDIFLNQEYDAFPVPVHDDMLDCMARILDEDFGAVFPVSVSGEDAYAASDNHRGSAWTY